MLADTRVAAPERLGRHSKAQIACLRLGVEADDLTGLRGGACQQMVHIGLDVLGALGQGGKSGVDAGIQNFAETALSHVHAQDVSAINWKSLLG